MSGRRNIFNKNPAGNTRTVFVPRNASQGSSSGGPVPQRYDASLGCFVDAAPAPAAETERPAARAGLTGQQQRGVRYMVKGRAPHVSQVARREAAPTRVLGRSGGGLPALPPRQPPPPPPPPPQQAVETGQLVLRKEGGRLVLTVGGDGDAEEEELVLQVPEGAEGEQLVLQDGAGGEVVLQVPSGDATSHRVVLPGGSGDGLVLRVDGGDGEQPLVIQGGEQHQQLVIQDGSEGQQLVIQDRTEQQHQQLVIQDGGQHQQEMVLDAAGGGGEMVLQIPEGSAGQELILEQEDGQQVVLQVPQGAAGPDGVIRLIQVTGEDGSVQYIASPSDDSGYTVPDSAATVQQFSVNTETAAAPFDAPQPAATATVSEKTPQDGEGAVKATETTELATEMTLEVSQKEGGSMGEATSGTDGGVAVDGTSVAPSVMETSVAETSVSDGLTQTVTKSEGMVKSEKDDNASKAKDVSDQVSENANSQPLREAESVSLNPTSEPSDQKVASKPSSDMLCEDISTNTTNPQPGGEKVTEMETKTPSVTVEGEGRVPGSNSQKSVEEALEQLMGSEDKKTESSEGAEKEGTPAPTSHPAPPSPAAAPLEPSAADEAPRGTDPATDAARGDLGALGGDGGDSDAAVTVGVGVFSAVCAVCGEQPRDAVLTPLSSAVLRDSRATPLTEALTECLGRSWETRPRQMVCVPCTVLVGQGYTHGPLQTSARDHLCNIWAIRSGEPLPEDVPGAAPADVTPTPTSPRSPVKPRPGNKGRRGRGRHRRGRPRRTEPAAADGPERDGDGGGPVEKTPRQSDGSENRVEDGEAEGVEGEGEKAKGGKKIEDGGEKKGEEERKERDNEKKDDGEEEGEKLDKESNNKKKGKGEKVDNKDGDKNTAGEEEEQEEEEEERPVIKKEPEDDRPVRTMSSGRRSRAPRAWSPDVDLTPRVKTAPDGIGRGKKRTKDLPDIAAKRLKPKATMIHVSKEGKKDATSPAATKKGTSSTSTIDKKEGQKGSKQQTGKQKVTGNGKQTGAGKQTKAGTGTKGKKDADPKEGKVTKDSAKEVEKAKSNSKESTAATEKLPTQGKDSEASVAQVKSTKDDASAAKGDAAATSGGAVVAEEGEKGDSKSSPHSSQTAEALDEEDDTLAAMRKYIEQCEDTPDPLEGKGPSEDEPAMRKDGDGEDAASAKQTKDVQTADERLTKVPDETDESANTETGDGKKNSAETDDKPADKSEHCDADAKSKAISKVNKMATKKTAAGKGRSRATEAEQSEPATAEDEGKVGRARRKRPAEEEKGKSEEEGKSEEPGAKQKRPTAGAGTGRGRTVPARGKQNTGESARGGRQMRSSR
ncbi:uncharacterized protein LOC122373375 [Amphibalanus amphitrite]|uniref:uncharacterized protein LOC122373375 n=1 Tax=Amphibalanus amphitrite TaxID=1232801 RepID=UPI001C901174|nr:uncharacterized protein LOC122373375 [Amphibalanus amphitrite]XP_043207287.1 uncharacterized protein LOC122373375 [Amphibalanus amphitrite]XP_043207288.1 uncharacterized protein LOC122373375 [Amphibalanus amphitrite]XP_043207290.1 uncharacterized protein LOC122373375 [Amphibalanus amphitrite]